MQYLTAHPECPQGVSREEVKKNVSDRPLALSVFRNEMKKSVSNGCGLKPGVTLIETIIALAMITIISTILFVTLGKSMRVSASIVHEQLVILALQNKFNELDQQHTIFEKADTKKPAQKPITFELPAPCPPGTIEYTVRQPSKTSALAPFKNLKIEELTARWQESGRPVSTTLVRLRFHPKGTDENTKRV